MASGRGRTIIDGSPSSPPQASPDGLPPGLAHVVTSHRYSFLAILGIVILRLAIGWHFVSEGYNKLRDKKPFSAAFFGAAKGPAQPFFRSLIWDYDGRSRLDEVKVVAALDEYYARATSQFGIAQKAPKEIDAELKKWNAIRGKKEAKSAELQAGEAWLTRREGLQDFFAVNKDEIKTYLNGLDRRAQVEADRGRMEVESLQGQVQKITTDLRRDVSPWLAQVDAAFSSLENELNRIGVEAGAARTVRLVRPDEHLVRAESVDAVIPYFDLTIGLLLIFGLFVRPATFFAAGFLAMVVASQLPGFPGVAPVYYQVVELAAVIALFGVNAGRFAGLDFFLSQIFRRRSAETVEG